MNGQNQRIVFIKLDERIKVRRHPEVKRERMQAIHDLIEKNHFSPNGDFDGPFNLNLRLTRENHLIFDIRSQDGFALTETKLDLNPFCDLIKNYLTICEKYFNNINTLPPHRVEALDMARRSVHNEGGELLKQALINKIKIDEDTARRLFTLICVLQIRG